MPKYRVVMEIEFEAPDNDGAIYKSSALVDYIEQHVLDVDEDMHNFYIMPVELESDET